MNKAIIKRRCYANIKFALRCFIGVVFIIVFNLCATLPEKVKRATDNNEFDVAREILNKEGAGGNHYIGTNQESIKARSV